MVFQQIDPVSTREQIIGLSFDTMAAKSGMLIAHRGQSTPGMSSKSVAADLFVSSFKRF